MELRELAEQVLFATTLEEKLRCPDVVTDIEPGPPLASPAAPGRPSGLRFRTSGSLRADFPGLRRLDQERERGCVLHFFANHELLATELMALVLLRFPEAPAAFRRGVLQTLKDEQEHTRLYLRRMEECGTQFGELPVSGYFWRSVSSMESPMDYVAGLSLTFEQANLDFCRQFSRGFHDAGDAGTARLLDRIHHDEIAHVAYGLKWFRRWKDPRQSDWLAFCRQLKFPLSPQRAKGASFNVESRRAAGLDPGFIAELEVFSQSRGRTPGVFVFNPFTEGRLAHGRGFNPVEHQVKLARDLANLPQFLGRQDDIVLLPRRPSVEFLSNIQQAGFALPEFVELEKDPGLEGLAGRKIGRLRPWAWGPDSLELLAPLFSSLSSEERDPGRYFNDDRARLYSKEWSASFLRELLRAQPESDMPAAGGAPGIAAEPSRPGTVQVSNDSGRSWADEPWLCTEAEVGVVVSTPDDAFAAIDAIRRRGHHRIVVKEVLGLAGRNAIRLWEPLLLEAQRRWIDHALQDGRRLIVEPWLEREIDFSVQLEMSPGGLKLVGYTGLVNNWKGQFQANWALPNHERRFPHLVTDLFAESRDIQKRFQQLYAFAFLRLELGLRKAGFLGPLGIDAFVYRTPRGERRLKPIVEINPRYTMGRLTLELMRHAAPGSHGLFRLVSRAAARLAGAHDFSSYARTLAERHPVSLEGQPVPRIREGALCLNDPATAEACLAVFQVSRTLQGAPNFVPLVTKFGPELGQQSRPPIP